MKAVIVSEDEVAIERFSIVLKNAGYEIIVYHWLMKALDNFEEIAPHLILISTRDYPRHWKTFAEYIKSDNIINEPQVILYTDENFSEDEEKKAECLGVRGTFSSYDVEGLDELRAILRKKNDIYSGNDDADKATSSLLDENKIEEMFEAATPDEETEVPSVETIIAEPADTEAVVEPVAVEEVQEKLVEEPTEEVEEIIEESTEEDVPEAEPTLPPEEEANPDTVVEDIYDPYADAEAEQEAIQNALLAEKNAAEQAADIYNDKYNTEEETEQAESPVATDDIDDLYAQAEAEQEAIQNDMIAEKNAAEQAAAIYEDKYKSDEDTAAAAPEVAASADDAYLEAEAEQEAIQTELLESKAEKEFDAEMLTPIEVAKEISGMNSVEDTAHYDFAFTQPQTHRIITGFVQSCAFPSLEFIPDIPEVQLNEGEEYAYATLLKDDQVIPVSATVKSVEDVVLFELEKYGE